MTARRPPRLARALLRRVAPEPDREALDGELLAELEQRPRRGAGVWYWRQVLGSLVPLAGMRLRRALRAARVRPPLQDAVGDLRGAARQAARRPGFAVLVLATLSLGIGVNTALFAVADAVLLRPPPWPEPERLVVVWERNFPRNRERNSVADVNYLDWRERSRSFAALAALAAEGAVLQTGAGGERIRTVTATPGFFDVLGVAPALGRAFQREDRDVEPRPAVVSHGFWLRHLGGDPQALGRELVLDEQPHRVVGVMPEGFEGPEVDFVWSPELWTPLRLREDGEYGGRWLVVLGRLADGVSVAAAQHEMEAIAARLASEHPYDEGWGVNVVPLKDQLVGHVREAIQWLQVAGVLLLLIACANAMHLVLSQLPERRQELAVRAALGASRGRLVSRLVAEGMLLAACGGLGGTAIASAALRALPGLAPPGLPRLDGVSLDGRVLAFGGAVALASVLIWTLPALRATRADVATGLAGARGSAGPGSVRLRRLLLVSEVALASALAVGAGLAGRSLLALSSVDAGFRPAGVLSARIALPASGYPDGAARARFHAELGERLRALPGVRGLAATMARPLGGGLAPATSYFPADRPEPPRAERPVTDVRIVSPGSFDTLGIPLIAGRDFRPSDTKDAPTVVAVNRTLAETHWPGRSALGRRLAVNIGDGDSVEIVAVVGDVRHGDLATTPRAKVYYTEAQLSFGTMDVVLRVDSDPARYAGMLRAAVFEAEPLAAVYRIESLEQVVRDSLAEERFEAWLAGAFAALGLLLAGIGIYGVLSESVARRRREIGIRAAVGAAPGRLARMVLLETMALAGLGLALGLAGAGGLSRLLGHLLFGVRPFDPPAFAASGAVLLVIAAASSALPARRAARVDPMRAVREP